MAKDNKQNPTATNDMDAIGAMGANDHAGGKKKKQKKTY
jgi:hypothetical protein